MATVLALVASLTQALLFTSAPHGAPASAATSASTGTGGMFVAVQGRIMDTRNGTGGYSTPMPANTWRPLAVDGQIGGQIPATGVSAVAVTLTALGVVSGGLVTAAPNGTASTPVTAFIYDMGTSGSQSGSAIVAVASDGKIEVRTTTAIDLIVDVQGYFTTGNGTPAPGGYVPVNPTRIVDTRTGTGLPLAKLPAGSTPTVQVSGLAGVPADASAVFASVTAISTSTVSGYLVAWPTGDPRPTDSLNFPPSANTAIGMNMDLNSSGQVSVLVAGVNAAIDLVVDVTGYYAPNAAGSGGFTPAAARVFDSRVAPHTAVASNATVTLPVAGVAGVPLAGSGITAVAISLQSIHNGAATGSIRTWGSDQTEPATSNLSFPGGNTVRSALAITRVGADGAIKLHNLTAGPVDVVLDVEGWYSSVGAAIPSGQDRTQQSITLQANPSSGGAWVTYQYRVGTTATFVNVPSGSTGDVQDSSGNKPTWPVTKTGGVFTAYGWNIRNTLIAALGSASDSLIQVQACYRTTATDPNPVCAMPSTVEFAQSAFGDGFATDQIGPGEAALLSGDYQVSDTDAASIGRTLTTLAPVDAGLGAAAQRSDASAVFGPGWTADLSGPSSGDADLRPTDKSSSGYLQFTGPDGALDSYQATTALGSYPISFVGVGVAAGNGESASKVNAFTITLTDSVGTVTTWTLTGVVWGLSSVTEAASNSTSTYSSYVGGASGTCVNTVFAGLPCRILMPVPAGVTCSSPDTTPGCQSLLLSYQTINIAGGNVTRLQTVKASRPQVAGTPNLLPVADYDYTTSGLLADTYDSRVTPRLTTAYSYNAAGRLASLTPPGRAVYSFGYDSSGRLSTISRPDPSGSTATTTVVYDVSTVTSQGGPIPLDAATTATWDQSADLPVTGTSVFPPDHQPTGTLASTVSTSDWPYATIHYLDVNGREVNTARYGAGAWQLDTAQYDSNGNGVWDLSAANRAQGLTTITGITDPYVVAVPSNIARADLLAATTVYNPLDPSEVTDTYGPTHPVTLSDASSIDARIHIATNYDEGAPNGGVSPDGASYGLPTTVTTTATNVATNTDTIYPDAQITRAGYAAITSGDPTGWSLYQPTTSTVQMTATPSAADLVTTTRYGTDGQVIETRLPGGAAGGTAQSTLTAYYAATGAGPCVSAAAAGQVCSTAPAAQPATGNPLPGTAYTYDQYGSPLTKTETYGTGVGATVRTTTSTYDAAERPATSTIAVTPTSAGGTALPVVTYGYDATTGLPATQSTGTGSAIVTLTAGYDTLGRPRTYIDGTGNTSTTIYDIDGRPISVDDGKGITSYGYGSATEHRGMITSEDIGAGSQPSTFTTSVDAAGTTIETYPNGLVATTSYDNAGNTAKLAYAKGGTTWMNFTATHDINDRTVGQTSPQSTQTFAYDPDGRLTSVADSYSGNCTTRTYSFDPDSNRTGLQAYPAAVGGACSIGTTPTTTATTYDQADRNTNAGYTYDTLGRTSVTPAVDAQGIGTHSGASGTLSAGYYANDFVASQTQAGQTMSFNLDPGLNRISTFTDGSTTTTNHFSGPKDSPSWVSTGTDWTRLVLEPYGRLAATIDQTGAVILQLANIHGDIVATAADTTTATGIATYSESTEYGQPRVATSAYTSYGWLGTNQRSTNALGGLALMGVRIYNPTTGRFATTDAIPGGNANSYAYPVDPVNDADPTGQASFGRIHCWARVFCDVYISRSRTRWFVAWMDRHPNFAGFAIGAAFAAICAAISKNSYLIAGCAGFAWWRTDDLQYRLRKQASYPGRGHCTEIRLVVSMDAGFAYPYSFQGNNGRYCTN